MRRLLLNVIGFFLVFSLCGCQAIRRFIRPAGKAGAKNALALPAYSGPKAAITVADFSVKASRANNEIGSELRKMLIKALADTNRFSIIEPQELAASLQAQKLVIAIELNEFDPQVSGGVAGSGGGGGWGSGIFGGLLGSSLYKAHIALDVRIVDGLNTEAVASRQVEGQATDQILPSLAGYLFDSEAGSLLSAYSDSPMQKAIYICIMETARYIAQAIPEKYYQEVKNGKT